MFTACHRLQFDPSKCLMTSVNEPYFAAGKKVHWVTRFKCFLHTFSEKKERVSIFIRTNYCGLFY